MNLYILNRPFLRCLLKKSMLLSLLLLMSSHAIAAITVNKTMMYFNAGESNKQDVIVYNRGTQPAYVKTEIFEVFNAGTPQEQRKKATDLGNLKLLISPNKMMIPAKGRSNIRFSYLGDHQKERVFRINVTPVVGKIKSDKGMAIKVLVAYQILMIVAPDNARATISHTRQGNSLLFKNNGNNNVLLSHAKLCLTEKTPSEQCKEIKQSKRLYAGNQWKVKVPHGQFIEFKMSNGAEYNRTVRRFN